MTAEKRNVYLLSLIIPVLLVPILFVPSGICRLVGAIALAAAACAALAFMKKKSAPSVNYRSVAGILAVVSIVYLSLTYILGALLGFKGNPTPPSIDSLWRSILPIIVMIVASELIRHAFLSQKRRISDVSAYIICLLTDLILVGGLSDIRNMSHFMDIVGLTLFPAITSNLFYHYLSKKYGVLPNTAFRLLLTLPASIMPVLPVIPNAIKSFSLVLLPLISWVFIDLLYAKKPKYALKRQGKGTIAGTCVMIVCLTVVIMLVSGLFSYKMIVIATPSMTGELNEGDAIIYKEYDGDIVEEGAVVVFSRNETDLIVHRVVDVQQIDGTLYYTTKGDANTSSDSGFITARNIRGIVKFKLPFIGQPTLWLRDLFV